MSTVSVAPQRRHVLGDGMMQRVVIAHLRPHTSILMNEQDPHRKTHYWELELACGHKVDRWIRWRPQTGQYRKHGFAAFSPSLSRLPKEPTRARCKEEA